MSTEDELTPEKSEFDFDAFPADTLFYERREVWDRREVSAVPEPILDPSEPRPKPERRARKERRRRICPTTFEKQYTDDELEFMNAMQDFKVQTGRSFPTHGEVLRVAYSLGYRKGVIDDAESDCEEDATGSIDLSVAH